MTGEPSAGSRRRQHGPVQNVAFQRCARCARASPSIHAMPPSSKQPAPAPARAGPRRKAKAGSEAGESTRLTVLAAALRDFADKGLAGARVDEIAQQAGVNQQAIYYHFGSKDELFKVVLDTLFDELRRDVIPATGERVELAALVRRFVLFTARRPELARIWVIESAHRGPHLTYMVDQHVLPLMRVAMTLIGRDMRADVDPTLLVYAIQGLVTYPFLVPQQVKGATGADTRDPAFAATYADVVLALLAPSMRH